MVALFSMVCCLGNEATVFEFGDGVVDVYTMDAADLGDFGGGGKAGFEKGEIYF